MSPVARTRLGLFLPFIALFLASQQVAWAVHVRERDIPKKDASVLILGGGVTGVIAARTLHDRGHDNFIVVDARDELGGRMQTQTFGSAGHSFTVEQGPNWVQGTQTGNGPKNPILSLAQKHGVKTQFNDLFGSLCAFTCTPRDRIWIGLTTIFSVL